MTGTRISDMTRLRSTFPAAASGVMVPVVVGTSNYNMDLALALNAVSLPEMRASGATSDVAALAAAVATGRPVYLPAGQGSQTGGKYQFSMSHTSGGSPVAGHLASGARIFGDGPGKTIVQQAQGFCLFADSLSSDPANNIKNVHIHDIEFTEDDTLAINTAARMTAFSGMTNLLIERCKFTGFRGDGLYIGSSLVGGLTRKNINVTVRGCEFDGVDNENRNAISVITGDGITIENCVFKNASKLDGTMPGAIDFEPDTAATQTIRNVRIDGNRFENCGGADIAFLLSPNGDYTDQSEHLTITNNTHISSRRALSFNGYGTAALVTASKKYGLRYEGNQVRSPTADRFIYLNGLFGGYFARNTYVDGNAFGFGDTNANRDIVLEDETFHGCGKTGYVLDIIQSVYAIWILRPRFTDCGKTDGTQGYICYARGAAVDFGDFRLDEATVEYFTAPTRTTAFLRAVGGYGGSTSGGRALRAKLSSLAVADNLSLTTEPTYTATNVTTDRAYDADTVVVAELADIVGTLIADLRAQGVVK